MNKSTFSGRLRYIEEKLTAHAKPPAYYVITTRLLENFKGTDEELAAFLRSKGMTEDTPYIVLPACEDTMDAWNAEVEAQYEDRTAYNRPNN